MIRFIVLLNCLAFALLGLWHYEIIPRSGTNLTTKLLSQGEPLTWLEIGELIPAIVIGLSLMIVAFWGRFR